MIMQKIPLNLATSEMVLARDIFKNDNPAGMPICGKGTELTESLINRLHQMGVQSLYVEGHPVWQEGDLNLNEQLEEMEQRFSKTRGNRYNNCLLDVYRNYITASMGDSGGRTEE